LYFAVSRGSGITKFMPLVCAVHQVESCSGRGGLRSAALSNALGGIGSVVPASSADGVAVKFQFGW
jgi:hypothetical protein